MTHSTAQIHRHEPKHMSENQRPRVQLPSQCHAPARAIMHRIHSPDQIILAMQEPRPRTGQLILNMVQQMQGQVSHKSQATFWFAYIRLSISCQPELRLASSKCARLGSSQLTDPDATAVSLHFPPKVWSCIFAIVLEHLKTLSCTPGCI